MSKYKRHRDEDDDETSYSEDMQGEALAQQQESEDDTLDDPEEKTYKKRYGDLRRHQQQTQSEAQKEIEALKQQLAEATKAQIKFPKTDAEIEAWTAKYPDVAAIVDTIARKRALEESANHEEKLKGLRELETKLTRREAETELMRLHPDFPDIRKKKGFHEWVEKQPKTIIDALYVNTTDPYSAARAIDLYKADMGVGKAAPDDEDDPKDAARSVGKTSRTAPDGSGKPKWSESKVAAMSDAEYDKNEDDILAAMKSGKFIYDISK